MLTKYNVNDFKVYTGKYSAGPTKGLEEKVVKDLVELLYEMNHTVYMDNYFTTVRLYMDLFQNGTYACGTYRRGQVGIPDEVAEARLKNQGEHLMMQRDNLVVTAWQNKRTVFVLSTNSYPNVGCTIERQKKSGVVAEVPCPQSAKNYTQYMNGVDHHDQLRMVYGISRKSLKW